MIFIENDSYYRLQFPESINELTKKDLRFIEKTIAKYGDSQKIRWVIFKKLIRTNWPFWWFLVSKVLTKKVVFDTEDLIDTSLACTSFLYEKQEMWVNPIPKIRNWFDVFYSVGNDFSDLTWGELMESEDAFLTYAKTLEPEYLDRLISIIYRPKKNGVRIKLNTDKLIKVRVSEYEKQLILRWYGDCHARFFRAFGDFGDKKEIEPQELSLQSISKQYLNWRDWMVTLAEKPQSIGDVYHAEARVVMVFIGRKIKEFQEIEKLKTK